MRFTLNLGGICASESFAEASREELRVLVAVISLGGKEVSEEELAGLSGVSVARCRSSIVLWTESGVITASSAEMASDEVVINEFDERRSSEVRYDKPSETVAGGIRDGELADFITECATLMGKPTLNTEEIKDLEYMINDLGVSGEYLLILIAHLLTRQKVVTPRILLKEVERLKKKNIDTAEALEIYISKLEKTTSAEWEWKNYLKLYRELSDREKKYVNRWYDELGFSIEIIREAYSIATTTITSTIPYSRIDRILSAWHEAGCKTVAECLGKGEEYREEKRRQERERAKGAPADKAPASKKSAGEKNAKYNDFDTEDALMAALKRSYGDKDGGDGAN